MPDPYTAPPGSMSYDDDQDGADRIPRTCSQCGRLIFASRYEDYVIAIVCSRCQQETATRQRITHGPMKVET